MSSSHGGKGSEGIIKAKRTRSFWGCTTCRSRRLKCDEAKPTCAKCRDARVTCGYENSLVFDLDTARDGDRIARYRRPLMSVEQRANMSNDIVSAIPPNLILRHISAIDDYCEDVPTAEDMQIRHGPFGVFRIRHDQRTDLEIPFDYPSNECSVGMDYNDELLYANEMLMSPYTQAALDALMSDQSCRTNLATFDPVLGLDDLEKTVGDLENAPLTMQDPAPSLAVTEDANAANSLIVCAADNCTMSRLITPIPCTEIDLHQSACVLLKHYLTNVLRVMTPFQHSKTPWHTLFVPLVKNCLVGIALHENLDRVSLCVFYGTLAISAASLSGTSRSSSWGRKSEIYRERAYDYAKALLQTAYDFPKTAKYKSQLMALLTIAQMSLVEGLPDQTENFLLEAEKLIRSRGLKRRKSRKVRLLHHCYAYERIFFESTAVHNACRSHIRSRVWKTFTAGAADAFNHSGLSSRVGIWENLETKMQTIKDKEVGENDLHLQVPGIWHDTLYPEIFGVPEANVMLVSLIIRLSHERETENGEETEDGLGGPYVTSFLSRAKSIEKLIKQQRPLSPTPNTAAGHLKEAMYHALIIYFYRRIYNINAWLLQQHVMTVRDCLLWCESTKAEKGFASVRLIWPAFVAACEAEEPAVRTSFLNWFEDAAQRSGLSLFRTRLTSIRDAWQKDATT